jgi:threonine dehydratase
MENLNELPTESDILRAEGRILKFINRTPVMNSDTINRMFDADIWFKCENLQKVGAFKARGATNAVFSLDESRLSKGVATHSSGNHAQALSWAAANRKTKAYIVMPSNSSKVKIDAVKGYGGIITFCDPTLEAREETLRKLIGETGATEIHPYNDYRIIAGQATAVLELFQQMQGFDIVMAPVGGGGLLSGTALTTRYISPGTQVIAAEPEQARDAYLSFTAGKLIPSENPQTLADGLRTSLGSLTFPIIMDHVHQIVTVKEETIIKAMKFTWERMKLIIEPSSAVPLAAIMENPGLVKGKKTGIILSGGNVDLDHLPWKS